MSNKSKVQVDPYLKVLQRIARSLESIDEGINMFAFHSEGVQECMAAQEAQEQARTWATILPVQVSLQTQGTQRKSRPASASCTRSWPHRC